MTSKLHSLPSRRVYRTFQVIWPWLRDAKSQGPVPIKPRNIPKCCPALFAGTGCSRSLGRPALDKNERFSKLCELAILQVMVPYPVCWNQPPTIRSCEENLIKHRQTNKATLSPSPHMFKPGQSGVVTCTTKPVPSSCHAMNPLPQPRVTISLGLARRSAEHGRSHYLQTVHLWWFIILIQWEKIVFTNWAQHLMQG